MDVSIVMTKPNSSIDKCIKYCLDRNVFCEKVENESLGSGKYICVPDENTYYHEYYIHQCWLGLNHKSKTANKYEVPSIVVFDSETEEFYMGEHENVFYRRSKGLKGPSYTDPTVRLPIEGKDTDLKVIMGCTLNKLKELPLHCPDEDEVLEGYYSYFVKEKKLD